MTAIDRELLTKVPAVTLGFWVIKILATTLGETGGDSVSMAMTITMELGYLASTAIFWRLWSCWWPHRSQSAGQHEGAQA